MKNIEKSRTSLKQVRQSKRLQPLRVLQWLNVKEVSVKKLINPHLGHLTAITGHELTGGMTHVAIKK
jgi:hypothetical protein